MRIRLFSALRNGPVRCAEHTITGTTTAPSTYWYLASRYWDCKDSPPGMATHQDNRVLTAVPLLIRGSGYVSAVYLRKMRRDLKDNYLPFTPNTGKWFPGNKKSGQARLPSYMLGNSLPSS